MCAVEEAAKIVEDIVSGARRGERAYYYGKIQARARDESLSDDVRSYLRPMGDVASYHFKRENTREPFGPIFQSADGRSAIPADLDEKSLEQLEELCEHLSMIELKARIYDVLWLRRRRPEFAERAISAYLRCAEQGLDLDHWTFCAEYAERALRLGSLFRRKKPELGQSAANVLLSWVEAYSDSDTKFLTARAIDLLCQFGYGNPSELHVSAIKIAKAAQDAGDFHRAEEYWKLAVRSAQAANDTDSAHAAQAALAECYAESARFHKKSGMLAAHWMQQAVEAYKAVPGSKERREELYSELLKYQAASLSEMRKFEHSIDISDIVTATGDLIEGKTTRDAIFTLAFGLACPPNYSKLEKQALELARKFPLSSLFGAVHLDHEGKVIARSEGSFRSPDGVSEREIYRLAAQEHQFIVLGHILPAIDIIATEHSVSESDLLSVVINNPFVARGQESLYAKGLYAGLDRDFVVATSILIPLLENSIRHVLKESGVRVSTLNTSGVQEVLRIGALLEHEKTTEIFGEDVVRDLRGLLFERTYGNLRNVVSHGLVSAGTFHQPCVVYLWWLVLRLCLTPHYSTWTADKDQTNEALEI